MFKELKLRMMPHQINTLLYKCKLCIFKKANINSGVEKYNNYKNFTRGTSQQM